MHPLLQSHHCGHYCLVGSVPWNPLQGFPSWILCRIDTQSAESLYILKCPPPPASTAPILCWGSRRQPRLLQGRWAQPPLPSSHLLMLFFIDPHQSIVFKLHRHGSCSLSVFRVSQARCMVQLPGVWNVELVLRAGDSNHIPELMQVMKKRPLPSPLADICWTLDLECLLKTHTLKALPPAYQSSH